MTSLRSEAWKLEAAKSEIERAGLQTEISLLSDQLQSRDVEIRQLEQEAEGLLARLSKSSIDFVSRWQTHMLSHHMTLAIWLFST